MSRRITDADRYASMKTYIEGLVDTSLFTSNVAQLVAITRSEGGVDTGHEIARVVLLSICIVIEAIVMIMLVYQYSQNINDLGEGAEGEEADEKKAEREECLKNINTACTVMCALLVLLNIVIVALSENQA
ncbi:PREDICTED: uncharacterized protein LOC109476023 [Branchiostoma belcheri]|uniref:Uncharacterized protein LOC109476023 n=1 Tax=Branchiostoma belcheri TaxID=7741 RepID=A0A6P4Z6W3_BRABE|nr:PREDICTED: uncharacterized protein LOC109476023 [Branchiostoma belcheri]